MDLQGHTDTPAKPHHQHHQKPPGKAHHPAKPGHHEKPTGHGGHTGHNQQQRHGGHKPVKHHKSSPATERAPVPTGAVQDRTPFTAPLPVRVRKD